MQVRLGANAVQAAVLAPEPGPNGPPPPIGPPPRPHQFPFSFTWKQIVLAIGGVLVLFIFAMVIVIIVQLTRRNSSHGFRIENSTLIDFTLLEDGESSIAFHFAYTILREDHPRNISTSLGLQGFKDFFLAKIRLLPPPVLHPDGKYAWFVDDQDTVRMSNSTQANSLALQIMNGKVTFDIRIHNHGDTIKCPVEATFPVKATKARKCRGK